MHSASHHRYDLCHGQCAPQLTAAGDTCTSGTNWKELIADVHPTKRLSPAYPHAALAVQPAGRISWHFSRNIADSQEQSWNIRRVPRVAAVLCLEWHLPSGSCLPLQGSMLDKHKLALQLSMRKASSVDKNRSHAGKPEKQSTKLIVRNVAFEATRKEVMSLFSPFGHMKSCRLPQKFDGTPR